jgi:hypothetical protein
MGRWLRGGIPNLRHIWRPTSSPASYRCVCTLFVLVERQGTANATQADVG